MEGCYFNRYMKKTSGMAVERKQNGKILTEYVYGIDSTGERKLSNITETELEKNKKTVSTYNSDGKITYKIVEEDNGNTTYTEKTSIATDGKASLQSRCTKTHRKNKIITETIVGNTTYFYETTFNDYGSVIKELIRQYNKEKDLENKVLTYNYKYDLRGNYTKKTIYLDGKPIIEINRVIGYYD